MATQPLVTCMKGLFLVFNFVFWVTGLGLLVVGILAKFAFSYMMKLSTGINYNLAPYIMIGCGVFIVLIGFMGCWAAVKEHGWALKLYMFVLIILILVEIGGAIAGYLLRGKVKSGLKDGMDDAVKNYYTDSDFKEAMDKVQESVIKCCGVTSYKDYLSNDNSTTNSTTTNRVPKSCCKNKDGTNCKYQNIDTENPESNGIYLQGCYDELLSKAKKSFLIVGGVAIGIAVFQILGVICAYVLTKQFKLSYEKM